MSRVRREEDRDASVKAKKGLLYWGQTSAMLDNQGRGACSRPSQRTCWLVATDPPDRELFVLDAQAWQMTGDDALLKDAPHLPAIGDSVCLAMMATPRLVPISREMRSW
jgi:hypothetical protein